MFSVLMPWVHRTGAWRKIHLGGTENATLATLWMKTYSGLQNACIGWHIFQADGSCLMRTFVVRSSDNPSGSMG